MLAEFLNMYLPIVDSRIPTDINAGGCGIFAMHLHKILSGVGFKTRICFVALQEQKEGIDFLLENGSIREKYDGIDHCMLEMDGFLYIDSLGVEMYPRLDCIDNSIFGEMPLDILEVLVGNINSWRTVFDRECEDMIVQELEKIPLLFEKFKEGIFEEKSSIGVPYTNHTIRHREMEINRNFIKTIASSR